jgi:peptidoglycan hydrolase-like protein with peptidoglycan-binding domain
MNTEHTEHEPEAVVEAAPETAPVAVEPAPPVEQPTAPLKAEKAGRTPSPLGAVVSGNERDNVSLAAFVVKNMFARKSLSVHHLQRRLAELGYHDAASDKDGWYGDLTVLAVAAFQAAEGLEATGLVDMATLEALFHDDANVTVTA